MTVKIRNAQRRATVTAAVCVAGSAAYEGTTAAPCDELDAGATTADAAGAASLTITPHATLLALPPANGGFLGGPGGQYRQGDCVHAPGCAIFVTVGRATQPSVRRSIPITFAAGTWPTSRR